jgi:uncharacterized membrane protein
MLRRAPFYLMTALCLAVACFAVGACALVPLGKHLRIDMRSTFLSYPYLIYIHVFASAVALTIGSFQFVPALRARAPKIHRALGRIYLSIGVFIGGVSGLLMALSAYGGTAARLGFGMLAAAWLTTGFLAYSAIRKGDVATHRRWMIRNFALTFAAVTLRVYIPASMAAGLQYAMAYPVIAWLCWVPNLLVAEYFLIDRIRGSAPDSWALPSAK